MNSGFPISQMASGSSGAAAGLGRQWRSGSAPALEDFLADWSSVEQRPAVSPYELAELVSLDQREKWRRGQRVAAEEYLRRFPQLLNDDELALDVIYSEFLLREELGEEPKPEEYQLRFPNFAETLLDQIEFHQAMAANRSSGLSELDTRRSASATQSHPGGERLPVHLTHSVPGYEILSELGRGGMGIVYRARQLSLNRLVALKMLRAGDCGSAALLARFQAEAEAVARLHHPNIVQIYDYGEHNGMPYLALELVEGTPLVTTSDRNLRTACEAAEIVVTLARAVQFAHEQGIVHRDLKPANVLIAAPAKGSSGRTTVKITDFGLAKVFREGEESPTQTGTIIGTPSYMAPEQARGQASLVGPATDVYALGAILYELVTGCPPFKAATAVEVLHQVLTTDAAPATRHVPRLARDLTTIIAKCLQKEPRQRYATAGELAEDLERFLADRPIRARRTSVAERGWRWCRRNAVLATLTCAVAGLLVAVAGVSILYSVHLREQLDLTSQAERREGDARKLAEVNLWDSYLGEIRAGNGSRQVGQRTRSLVLVDRANQLLDSIGRTPERVLKLRNATIASLAFADFLPERRLGGEPGQSVAFSVAADRFASLSPTGVAQVYRLSTGESLYAIPTQTGAGEGIVQLSADGRYLGVVNKGGAKVWRCQGETPPVAWDGPRTQYLTFSPDSRRAAASDFQGKIQLIDLGTGQTLPPLAGQHTARCACAFHPDSRRIAVCAMLGVVVFDVESGQVLSELPQSETSSGTGIVWHPGGQAVIVSGLEEGCALWDVAERRRLVSYPHRAPTGNLHFSCDGSLLVTRDSWSAELRIWSTGTGLEVLHSPRFAPLVADCSASEGDSFLLVEGDSLALWRLDAGLAPTPLLGAAYAALGEVQGISISPDNRLLAAGRERGFEIWDLGTGRRSSQPSIPGCIPLFMPSGDLLISSSWGLFRWPRSESRPASKSERGLCQFGPPERLSAMLADKPLGMTADGSAVAVRTLTDWRIVHPGGADQLVTIPANNQDDPRCLTLSPDGRWLAMSNWHYLGTNIWDTASGRRVEKIPTGSTGAPLFSPDGRWLATTPDGGQLWSVGDWKPGASLHALGTTPSGLDLAFSPDSSVLAVSQPQGTTRLVDPLSGADWAELLRSDPRRSSDLCFSPDQSLLIEMPLGDRSEPRVWRLTEIRRELASRGLDWPADVLPARPAADANPPPWTVVLNAGNLVNQQAAAQLVTTAAGHKNLHAKQQLQRAVELDPENPQAHNELAWLLVAAPKELRDSQAAVRHARRALELNVDKATYWNTLGVALYRDAQYSEAIATLEESLRRGGEPTAGFDLIFLALCHHALGNQELARQNLKEATAWFESRRMKLSSAWLEELTAFLNEANAKLPVASGRD